MFKRRLSLLVGTICIAFEFQAALASTVTEPFKFVPGETDVVVQYDSASGRGFNYDWGKGFEDRNRLLKEPEEYAVVTSARYLQEAIGRMTGEVPAIRSDNDVSKGLIMVLLENAPEYIQKDPRVVEALKNSGADDFNDREAFYILTEDKRVWLIANTGIGLCQAVPMLLESVGYQSLGVGPNWTHVPDYKKAPLIFSVAQAGRPGFYLRRFIPHSGQLEGRSAGTLNWRTSFSDSKDESVEKSYERWQVGSRLLAGSMAMWPGHALDGFHGSVAERMIKEKRTEGFLADAMLVPSEQFEGLAAASPGTLAIITDQEGPHKGKIYVSDGKKWALQSYDSQKRLTSWTRSFLDLSVPFVREVIRDIMIERANNAFRQYPERHFVFGTDPEDGGISDEGFAAFTKNPNWYPEYRAAKGKPFGNDYPVDGFLGLDQPKEEWTAPVANPMLAGAAQTNSRFALSNWLLDEYDKYVDGLPAVQDDYSNPEAPVIGQFTSTGGSKKDLIRTAIFSYNYHDVIPEFQLDQRIRVMIAGFPKHRGTGKWEAFASNNAIAGAFKKLLPRQPSAVYWILSYSTELDDEISDIKGNPPLPVVWERTRSAYENGIQGVGAEVDLNFGTYGIMYYLYAKMLWNPSISLPDLEKEKEKWIRMAFGKGAEKMKEYFEMMQHGNFVNAPNFWAKAIRLIDEADLVIADDSDEQKRIDDFKQFWLYYYFVDRKASAADSKLREFMWKGQMSYMTAMHVVGRRFFAKKSAFDAVGPEFHDGPAHYSHGETAAWWDDIKKHWPYVEVEMFPDSDLGGGVRGRDVDVHDLVAVAELQSRAPGGFINDATDRAQVSFYTTASKAGQDIGFKLFWKYIPDKRDFQEKSVPYGISFYDRESKDWKSVVDISMTSQRSAATSWSGSPEHGVQSAEVRFQAPWVGTYRIDVGPGGGEDAWLWPLGHSFDNNRNEGNSTHTYFTSINSATSSPAFFYIPRNVKTLDLEIPDPTVAKRLTFFRGLPAGGMKVSRIEEIPVGFKGTKRYPLQDGESGSLVKFEGGRSVFSPYLYSVPTLWAQSPSALLVPRKIVEMDQLTPLNGNEHAEK